MLGMRRVLPMAPRLFSRSVGEMGSLETLGQRESLLRRATLTEPAAEMAGRVPSEIDSYSQTGFVVNGITMRGAVLLMPELRIMFSIPRVEELTPRSLEVLRLCNVTPPLLIIGCGRQVVRPPAAVRAWADQHGITIEAMSSKHACSTFNFMVQEHRSVAALLMPNELVREGASLYGAPAPQGAGVVTE